MEYIGLIFLSIGVLFLILGALGILRFPDLFNRMQAGTKATTFGAIFSIMGVGFMEPSWLPKTFVIVLFILLSNPVSSHALARAAYRKESKLWKNTVIDEYADISKIDKKEEE